MRQQIQDRYYRFLTRQDPLVPDVEFGFWPQTIRRWVDEGMPRALIDEWDLKRLSDADINDMFNPKLLDFFGFDRTGEVLLPRTHINPAFPERVIEDRGHSTVVETFNGIVMERYPASADESSIPRYLSFPVSDADDWQRMRRRYRPDDPTRRFPESELARIRTTRDSGRMIEISLLGFYGQMRNWMGFETLSLTFYDDPSLIDHMVGDWADLIVSQIERLPDDIPIDYVSFWEDMAGKNGPFMSPEQFERFIVPGYRRVMEAAAGRGCELAIVDCDGNPAPLVPHWFECGVNIMFPLEVAAGADPAAWRNRCGEGLLLRGGVDKRAVAAGGDALERELDRVGKLVSMGGFIPHLDHLVDPDISYESFLTYLEKKRSLIA
ncbi:uroporphyrinogen decarboxylase family protein [Salinispira pacifica]